MGIDDVTMGDAQLVQAGGPEFEFRTVCASETDVVQPWASLIETVSRIRCAVRVQTEQHAAVQRKHDMVEVAAVLIENWVDIEEPAIPFAAGPKVGHGHGDVGDRGEVGKWGIGATPVHCGDSMAANYRCR